MISLREQAFSAASGAAAILGSAALGAAYATDSVASGVAAGTIAGVGALFACCALDLWCHPAAATFASVDRAIQDLRTYGSTLDPVLRESLEHLLPEVRFSHMRDFAAAKRAKTAAMLFSAQWVALVVLSLTLLAPREPVPCEAASP